MHNQREKNNDRGNFREGEIGANVVDLDSSISKSGKNLPDKKRTEFQVVPESLFWGRVSTIVIEGTEASIMVFAWILPRVLIVGGGAWLLWIGATALIKASGMIANQLSVVTTWVTKVVGYGLGFIVIVFVIAIFLREIIGLFKSGSKSSPGSPGGYDTGSSRRSTTKRITITHEIDIES